MFDKIDFGYRDERVELALRRLGINSVVDTLATLSNVLRKWEDCAEGFILHPSSIYLWLREGGLIMDEIEKCRLSQLHNLDDRLCKTLTPKEYTEKYDQTFDFKPYEKVAYGGFTKILVPTITLRKFCYDIGTEKFCKESLPDYLGFIRDALKSRKVSPLDRVHQSEFFAELTNKTFGTTCAEFGIELSLSRGSGVHVMYLEQVAEELQSKPLYLRRLIPFHKVKEVVIYD